MKKKEFTEKSRRIKNLILGSLCLLLFCVGCGDTSEEEALVIADNEEEAGIYTLYPCETGDVVLSKNISCEYVQAAEQQVTFEIGGKKIDRVCVREGDRVKTGDVLIKLEDDNLEEQIENLSYQIESNKLSLGYLDASEKFAKADAYYNVVYGSGFKTEDDTVLYEKRIAEIEKEYRYNREDYSDSIEFDTKKLQKLKSDLAASRLYAQMDGLVTHIERDLEGAVSRKDQAVMTIVDESEGYFVVNETGYLDDMAESDIIQMHVTYGDAVGDYELAPDRKSDWDDTIQYFKIISAPDEAILSIGIKGTITVTIDSVENVMCLPVACVHEAGDDRYVYVLDENGMKAVRYVKIGLIGNEKVQILEGLELGEQVVKK